MQIANLELALAKYVVKTIRTHAKFTICALKDLTATQMDFLNSLLTSHTKIILIVFDLDEMV